ncbi:hypothetical protein ACMFMG_011400 [Clarireedia jacksonii]
MHTAASPNPSFHSSPIRLPFAAHSSPIRISLPHDFLPLSHTDLAERIASSEQSIPQTSLIARFGRARTWGLAHLDAFGCKSVRCQTASVASSPNQARVF